MVVGAYRDNEVNSAHPLTRKLEAFRKAGARVQEIILAPWPVKTWDGCWRILFTARRSTSVLWHGWLTKDSRQSIFAIQFISALAEEGLLTFDHGDARWSWDLNRIHARRYTDNVVDLMVGKLNRLPVETQTGLTAGFPAWATAQSSPC